MRRRILSISLAALCAAAICAAACGGKPENAAPYAVNWGEWAWTAHPGTEERVCKTNPRYTEVRLTGTGGFSFALNGPSSYRVRKGTAVRGDVRIPAFYRPDADSPFLPVTEIGENAFDHSASLTSVTIPESVTAIGSAAFNGCDALGTVTFAYDSRLESIGDNAFNSCTALAVATIAHGSRVKNTFIRVFDYFGLTGVIIPKGVTSIGEGAFAFCDRLTSVTIPASVTAIGEGAFAFCEKLATIKVDAENPQYASESGILYNKVKTELLEYPSAKGSVIIPVSITSIGDNAFYGFTSLTSVTFPGGVTAIGEGSFSLCTSLTSVTFAAGSQLQSIGYTAFANCTRVAHISIPARVTAVGSAAFFGWNSAQTITVEGHPNQASADAAWGKAWRNQCRASINYEGRR